MTERDLEQRLRADLRQMVDETAPSALRASVIAIPDSVSPTPQRRVAAGWGFPPMNRFASFGLAATALVVVIVIGFAFFLRPAPDVGPSPIPGPTDSSTAEPTSEPAAPASWSAAGSMLQGRVDFTATLLLDGRVLVTGGDLGSDAVPRALATAELYDPATGTWTATGSMLQGRYRHTATLLPDGRVLVAGGNVNSSQQLRARCCLATAELYDPATGTWTATGNLIAPRVDHIASVLPDGTVLVAGGDSYPNTGLDETPAEVYDPATGTWSATGGTFEPNHDQRAVLLPSGRVFVTGGSGLGGPTQLYDPISRSWSVTACCVVEPEGNGQPNGSATVLSDDTVLVAGGTGVDQNATGPRRSIALDVAVLYDPLTATSTATGSLNALREGHVSATLLPNGMVLVVGGSGRDFAVLASAELYDPGTGTWVETASPTGPRQGHRAILLLDGTVLIMGGTGSEDPTTGALGSLLASAELYDPGSGS
jgi:hypothetical protein